MSVVTSSLNSFSVPFSPSYSCTCTSSHHFSFSLCIILLLRIIKHSVHHLPLHCIIFVGPYIWFFSGTIFYWLQEFGNNIDQQRYGTFYPWPSIIWHRFEVQDPRLCFFCWWYKRFIGVRYRRVFLYVKPYFFLTVVDFLNKNNNVSWQYPRNVIYRKW